MDDPPDLPPAPWEPPPADLPDQTLLMQTVPDSTDSEQIEAPDPAAAITTKQIEQVFQWVVEGKSQDDIVASVHEYWPGVDVAALSLAVTTRLMEASSFTPSVVKGMCIEATRLIYQKALETSELVVALRAIRQLWEMTSTTKI